MLGAAATLLAVLITVAVVWLTRPTEADLTPYKAKRPADAVRGYLQGLATAKAQTAIGFGARPPLDVTYLTDVALARSLELAPLTIQSVTDVEGVDGAALVPARISFGDRAVELGFETTRSPAGWRVETLTSKLELSTRPDGLTVDLNGVPVPPGTTIVEVFPGTYRFGEAAALVDLTSPQVTVAGIGTTVSTDLAPILAKNASATLISRAKSSLKKCLAKKDADPQGCPNTVTVPAGAKVVASSVAWRLSGDPWRKVAVRVNNQVPMTITGTTRVTFGIKARLVKDKETYKVNQKVPYNVEFSLDVNDPKAPVIWKRILSR